MNLRYKEDTLVYKRSYELLDDKIVVNFNSGFVRSRQEYKLVELDSNILRRKVAFPLLNNRIIVYGCINLVIYSGLVKAFPAYDSVWIIICVLFSLPILQYFIFAATPKELYVLQDKCGKVVFDIIITKRKKYELESFVRLLTESMNRLKVQTE